MYEHLTEIEVAIIKCLLASDFRKGEIEAIATISIALNTERGKSADMLKHITEYPTMLAAWRNKQLKKEGKNEN